MLYMNGSHCKKLYSELAKNNNNNNRVGVIFLCIKLKKETTTGLQKGKVALQVSAQKAWKMEH